MEINSLNSLSKKTCFSLTSVFYDMCKSYMEEHEFHNVCYVRFYTDGSQINLTTHPEWAIDFILQGFADNLEFMHDLRSFDKTSYFIFSLANKNEQVIMDYASQHYQIGDGICLISNFPTYQEQFYFAFKTGKEINLNLLINQLHLLQNHVFFFREQARYLIKDSEKDKIYLPAKKISVIEPTIEGTFDLSKKSITPVKRYYIDDRTWLTQREYLCANWWIKGYTSSDIAAVLNLSVKTIHSYIEQVKNKLNCAKRSDVYMAFTRIFGI